MLAGRSVLMSSWIGTSGQCLLRIRRASGSISHWNTTVIPDLSRPRSKPPIPAKNEATLTAYPPPVTVARATASPA